MVRTTRAVLRDAQQDGEQADLPTTLLTPTPQDRDSLNVKSVKELKGILEKLNTSYAGCVEKKDLVDKIISAQSQTSKSPKRAPGVPYERTIEGLRCIVMETDPNPELLVYVLHGFGANAEDLSGIGSTLLRQGKVRTKKARFYVVNAPMSMGQGSYCWWPLNMQDLMMRIFTVGVEGLFDGPKPKEVKSSTEAMQRLIANQEKETKIPMSKTVICGFSQGSWLATNIVCESKARPAALVLYSSALYRKEWGDKLSAMQGLRVLQYHGTQDPILPIQQGKMLAELFVKSKCDHKFRSFQGGHTIPPSGIADMDALLVDVAEGK